MKCPRCNFENQEGSAFCSKCGLQLSPPMQNQNHQQPQQNMQMNQHQYGNPNFGYQMNAQNKSPKTPFYRKTWFIVLMCIFFPPVGIVFMWISAKPKNTVARIILTVFLSLYSIVWLVGTMTDTNENRDSDKKVIENNIEESKEEEDSEKNIEKKDENKEDDSKKGERKEKERKTEFEYGDCVVKYIRHEIMENDMGETVLVVYYDFTNNGEEPQSFDYLVSGKAFQNGVEIERSYFHANEESKNSGKEIQTGGNVTVADSYVLGDSRDNVMVEFRPFNVWSDKLLMSMELTLE